MSPWPGLSTHSEAVALKSAEVRRTETMNQLNYKNVADSGTCNVGSNVGRCFATCYSGDRACRLIDVIRAGAVTSSTAMYSCVHILLPKT